MELYVITKEWRSYPDMEFVDSEIHGTTNDLNKAKRTALSLNQTCAHYWDANPYLDDDMRMYECIVYCIAVMDAVTDAVTGYIEPEELGYDMDHIPMWE